VIYLGVSRVLQERIVSVCVRSVVYSERVRSRACVRACMRVCVCVRERERERIRYL